MTPTENEIELKTARIIEPSTPSHPVTSLSSEPVAQTQPQPQSRTSSPPPNSHPSRSRRLLPAVIVAGALVLLGGSSAAAYSMWYQSPDRVLASALTNMLQAEQLQQSTIITSDTPIPVMFLPLDVRGVTFESVNDVAGNNSMKLGIDIELDGQPFNDAPDKNIRMKPDKLRVEGEAIVIDDGKLYFKLNDMKSSFMKFAGTMGADDNKLSARADELMDQIDNTWIETNAREKSAKSDQLSCVLSEIKGSKTSVTQAVQDTYQKNSFLTVDKELPTKDGNLGYRVTADRNTADKFYGDLRKNDGLKALNECIGSDDKDKTPEEQAQIDEEDDLTFDIWISRWKHELREINFKTSDSNDSDLASKQIQYTINSKLDFGSDPEKVITAPKGARPLSDWQKSLEELGREIQTAPAAVPGEGTAQSLGY